MNKGKDENIIKRYVSKDKVNTGFISLKKSVDKEEKAYIDSLLNNEDNFTKLQKLYEYSDAIYSQYYEKSVCQKGCAHCCKIKVSISELEAEYIKINTKFKSKQSNNDLDDYCPLLNLDTGLCSIYEFRPLSCRTFLTFDNPEYCKEKTTEHVVTTLNGNPKLHQMYQGLFLTSNPILKDIRDYF
ncbi:YkgJ family cysteine cluster protein [Malaciobacter marinus]|uniref:YkgJ family cysteine cluster protein n=1 Tax=Malaciobacter marinus TaxID=505249 RepID=UPI003B00DA1B